VLKKNRGSEKRRQRKKNAKASQTKKETRTKIWKHGGLENEDWREEQGRKAEANCLR